MGKLESHKHSGENAYDAGRPQPRLAVFDILRGFAICAVATLHGSYVYMRVAPMDRFGGAFSACVHLLAGFGVPLFLIVSAAVLALRYPDGIGSWRDYLAFLRRRCERLLPAYVVWSLVSAYRENADLLWPPGDLLHMLATGSADSQFYFVPLIFEVYLLWPLLGRLASLSRRSAALGWFAVVASAAASVLFWRSHELRLALPLLPRILLFWMLYTVAGLAAAPHLSRFAAFARSRLVLPLAGAAVLLAAVYMGADFFSRVSPPYNYRQLTLAAMVFLPSHLPYYYAAMLALLLFALRFERSWAGRAMASLGRHSFGVFLIHLLIMRSVFFKRLVGMPSASDFSSPEWVLGSVLIPAATLLVSYCVVAAMAKVPVLKTVVGEG